MPSRSRTSSCRTKNFSSRASYNTSRAALLSISKPKDANSFRVLSFFIPLPELNKNRITLKSIIFLRACLRGSSDANRRAPCHHCPCLWFPCVLPPFLQKVWIQNGDPTAETDRDSICKTRYRSLETRSHLITGEDRTQRRECVAVITLSTSLGRV